MQTPLLVRPPTDEERRALVAGLRSVDTSVLRRCQALLASARGERTSAIAWTVGFSEQAVRNAIHAFTAGGSAALVPGSSRPRAVRVACDADGGARLRDLLHRSPREFGYPTGAWTLALLAEVAHAESLAADRVTGETVSATLARLGVCWRRAEG